MFNILYVVSTLGKSGPTSQLYNIISNLDKSTFTPQILTLSPEPEDSRWGDFSELGVTLSSLKMSRLQGLILAKYNIKKCIEKIKPDIVHTQGIRADSVVSSLSLDIPWVATSRNFPSDDYPSKYGSWKGKLMAYKHFSAMKECSNLVACSKTLHRMLDSQGIRSVAIQNGVRCEWTDGPTASLLDNLPRPIFISVGSLIPRKNMKLLIEAFKKLPKENRGSLVILGDGPLKSELVAIACDNIILPGNVDDVSSYLAGADCFLSSSLSEGLPNTVLEALAVGLPVILSDIDSHLEIVCESSIACKVFSLEAGVDSLCSMMKIFIQNHEPYSQMASDVSVNAMHVARNVFSSEAMSSKYQNLYLKIMEG
ncbi:glycosyltransferase [Halomonas sp. RT37]|uniref:Glycosyltransferase n=1 Tax=Halomonas sp. RT37 TaxID=2950872 RepID=A0AAU7KMT1_9GAMM